MMVQDLPSSESKITLPELNLDSPMQVRPWDQSPYDWLSLW